MRRLPARCGMRDPGSIFRRGCEEFRTTATPPSHRRNYGILHIKFDTHSTIAFVAFRPIRDVSSWVLQVARLGALETKCRGFATSSRETHDTRANRRDS